MTISGIYELLGEYEPQLVLKTNQEDLSCVKLLTADVSCGMRDILLGRAEDFIRYDIPAVIANIICIGNPQTARQMIENRLCNMIVIEKHVDIFSLCNLISGCISSSIRQESGFLEALSTTSYLHRGRLTLDYLASMARRLLLNPCVIANANGDILASDFPSGQSEAMLLEQELFMNELPAFLREQDIGALVNRTEIFNVKERCVILGTISGRSRPELFFVLMETDPFSQYELLASRLFCSWAGSELKSGKIDLATITSRGSKYLDYLLNSPVKDPETIRERNAALAFREQENCFLIVADVSDYSFSKGSLSSLISTFENKSRQVLATLQENYLVVLLSCQECDEKSALKKLELDEYLQYLDIPFGISMVFYSLANVSDAFRQACCALQLGSVYSPGKKLYCYNDFLLLHLLDKCNEHTDISFFVLPQVNKLFEYDRIHKTQYAYTLYIVLLAGNKQISAANMLNIHRTTLQYRLEKIKNLINIDFYDLYWASRLYLSYSILIHEKKADPTLYNSF